MVLTRTLLVALFPAAVPTAAAPPSPPAPWLLDHVKALAAPDMESRASGTPGAERAARHVAAEFQRLGLRPGGDGGTWLQSFAVPTGLRLGEGNFVAVPRYGGGYRFEVVHFDRLEFE